MRVYIRNVADRTKLPRHIRKLPYLHVHGDVVMIGSPMVPLKPGVAERFRAELVALGYDVLVSDTIPLGGGSSGSQGSGSVNY